MLIPQVSLPGGRSVPEDELNDVLRARAHFSGPEWDTLRASLKTQVCPERLAEKCGRLGLCIISSRRWRSYVATVVEAYPDGRVT